MTKHRWVSASGARHKTEFSLPSLPCQPLQDLEDADEWDRSGAGVPVRHVWPNYQGQGGQLAQIATGLGGVWVHFKQAIFLNGQQMGKDGVCGALSMVFLARVKSGAGQFSTYVNSADGRAKVMSLWTTQQTHVAGWEKAYLAGVGLKERYQRRNDTLQQIEQLVLIPGYYDIILSNNFADISNPANPILPPAKMSAHAFAVINDKDNHFAFDPNWGIGGFSTASAAAKMLLAIAADQYGGYSKGETILSRYS